MKKLSIYLPPLSPDYSGACSCLYSFNSLIVIHDAQGCTANYTGFDEPRWYGSKKPVYCSGLRKIDVAMGNEDRTIKRIIDAANEFKPLFIAIVGSPVPLVMGTDFKGLANKIENACGITTIGIPTNGLGLYPNGISQAGKLLFDRFLPENGSMKKRYVNILGGTPLDYLPEEISDIVDYLENNSFKVNFVFSLNNENNNIEAIANAGVNLAVSQGGVELCKWMEKYFGIPWMAGIPIGNKAKSSFIKKLIEVEDNKVFGYLWGDETISSSGQKDLLIIQDEIIGKSIAYYYKNELGINSIQVASPFFEAEDKPHNVIKFQSEKEIIKEVNSGYKQILSDPLILDLIKTEDTKKIPFGHFAVSSHFRKQYTYNRIRNSILDIKY